MHHFSVFKDFWLWQLVIDQHLTNRVLVTHLLTIFCTLPIPLKLIHCPNLTKKHFLHVGNVNVYFHIVSIYSYSSECISLHVVNCITMYVTNK